MTLSMDLARAVNCTGLERPCGECESCRKTGAGLHPDVQIIGLIKNEDTKKLLTEISIEQVGDLQRAASLPPFEGRTKVFIIDGAELLSPDAANRLLKTLEEPSPNCLFILLASEEKLVPATVVSRCQKIDMRPVPVATLEASLRQGHGITLDMVPLVARLAHGCPGRAFNAVADSAALKKRTDLLDKLVMMIQSGYDERFVYAGQLALQFGQERARTCEILDFWLEYWHDLLLEKAGCPELICGIDRTELAALAKECSLEEIRSFITNIRACHDHLRKNVSAKLALENLMLEMPRKDIALPKETASLKES